MNVPSDDPDPSERPSHLACAYSPRWLSGPTHYEGLVAVASDQDDVEGADAPTGSSGPSPARA
jgi:hypothetical protein